MATQVYIVRLGPEAYDATAFDSYEAAEVYRDAHPDRPQIEQHEVHGIDYAKAWAGEDDSAPAPEHREA